MAMMLSIFSCAYWPFTNLWRNFYLNPLPVFKLGCHFITELFKSSTSVLNTDSMMYKHLLPFYGLSFHFLDGVLYITNAFNIDEVQFI